LRSRARHGKYCVLELKNPFAEKDIKRLVGEIGGTGRLDRIIFISFDMKNCLVLRSLLPAARIQFLTSSPVTPEIIQTLKEKRFGIDIKHDLLTAELAALLRANGIVINCWTVDDPERAEELIKMGVDQITSNILE
jgi:glycerophosphoryl diester phosphodiesterase